MNIVFCHINSDFAQFGYDGYSYNNIPEYTFISLRQARYTNPESDIFLICDTKKLSQEQISTLNSLNIKVVSQDNLINEKIINVKKAYVNNLFNPSLKNFNFVTLIRLYFVENLIQKYNLTNVFHLEYDNLLYVDLNNILCYLTDDVYLGKVNENTLICGFSFFRDGNSITKITDIMLELMEHRQIPNVTEMILLGIVYGEYGNISIFNQLPNESGYIFDPCSYGQFIAGTNNGHKCGFMDSNHDIGKFLQNNIKNIKFKKDTDITISYNGIINKFVNLHVHNKKAIPELITYDR